MIAFARPGEGGVEPRRVVNDETVVRGLQTRRAFKSAVHKSISDW